jgi:hypothetical protein
MFSREIVVSTLLEEATVGNDKSQRIKDGDNSTNSFPLQLAEISNVVILNVANGTQSLLQKDALKGVADNQVSEHCNFNMIEAEKHVE